MELDQCSCSGEQFDDDDGEELVSKNLDMYHMGWCLVIVRDVRSLYIYHKDFHSWICDDVDVDHGDDKMARNCSNHPNTVD